MLPNFIIPGPPKSGTTTLRILLGRHHDIYMPDREIGFFNNDENYDQGLKWYEKFFDKWNGEKAVGEKTPSYFFHPKTPARIKKCLPDAKIIFIFRNPVDRSYSHYWHDVRKAEIKESFEGVIKKEIKGEIQDFKRRYLEISTYIIHLKRWERYFSKSQMFFLTLEGLNKEKLREVLKFLEVDENFDFGKLKKYNIGGAPRSRTLSKLSQHRFIKKIPYLSDFINRVINMRRGEYPAMKQGTRIYLLDYFKEYNKELERFTGIDLKMWEK
ncbi:MAG: hypothetical protein DRP84_08515 [Spirochaetes bacterium]|nr:MAG: hypothetical protein DRP84_08515 [Spirochaetota bacterium]